MRAKMSERWERPTWGLLMDPVDTRSMTRAEIEVSTAMALREARGILAETEPQPFDYQLEDGRWTSHVWDFYPHGHGMSETRAAIAESLAAFINQEMS